MLVRTAYAILEGKRGMKRHKLKKSGVVMLATMIVVGLMTVFIPAKPPGVWTEPSDPQQPTASHDASPSQKSGTVFAHDDVPSGLPWRTEQTAAVASILPHSNNASKRPAADRPFVTINDKTYPLRTYQMLALPNDPQASQWWVASSGLDVAWDIPAGPYQTTLAIIDSGFALNHEEFADRWYQNGGELGATAVESTSRLNCTDRGLAMDYACNLVDDNVDGIVDNESGVAPYENPSRRNCSARGLALDKSCNLTDDDGNGYADDTRGWDMINQDSSVQAGQLSPAGSGTTHGTMVAGVASATGNNGKGIAGVNWSTKILPIQALDDDGYGNTKSVGDAIFYAVDRGVDVINVSLGTEFHDDYVREAVEAATAAGITIVASSGNDGCDCIVYPARYPEVVAVGALDATGNRAGFSSWGGALDIAAPGASMTLPSWSSTNPNTRYVSGAAGTSFSSPLVAGALALAKSHRQDARPLHLISALRETTNRSSLPSGQVHDSYLGYGKVNVSSLRGRMTTAKHTAHAYAFSPIASGGYFTGKMYEAAGPYAVQDCGVTAASMPVYELKNASTSFFSVSEVETRRATQLGFSVTLFAHACMRQPQDTVDSVRMIDLFREFRNVYRKL